MNAAFMAPLSFDYAADARGFGWGFAAEWYQENWVLRIGRMTGPKEPNMLPTDFQIGKHYGDQFELERALLGQPGKRLLAWRNRVLASFKDALDYLKANPDADPQAITAVRNGERIKYGAGINIEQAINDEPGFLPTRHEGWPDRDLRLHRDRRLHRGFALKGAAWGRGMDTVGVGFAHNTLSSDRRKYLEAGGISFFIGDGALN
jgi:hypothetical protein